MGAMLRYSVLIYLANYHFLSPLLLIFVYAGFLYVLMPLGLLGYFALSAAILFTACISDGLCSYKIWDQDMRVILVMKSGSAIKFYMSAELLLVLLTFVYTILTLLVPGILFILDAGEQWRFAASNLWALLLLHLLVALCGYEIGSLFQPHMIGGRPQTAIMIFITVLGIFLRPELSTVPVVKYLFWIFPPIAKVLRLLFTEQICFSAEIKPMLIQLSLYALLLLAGKWCLLSRRKWAVYE